MAHFAQLDENSIVQQVIVVSDDDAPTEEAGQAFIASLGLAGEWKKTSYNTYRDYKVTLDDSEPPQVISVEYLGSKHRTGGTPFRGQYAGIGDRYDTELDEFITPVSEVEE
jgi:hypothetical protein